VSRKILFPIFFFVIATVFLAGCSVSGSPKLTPTAQPQGAQRIANPASVNCIKLGGKEVNQTRGDGGQYGICVFPKNQQCEEWALFHGKCPLGGVTITGYGTDAATYCAITGGKYSATANKNQTNEQGNCTLPAGNTCDAVAYYDGKCQ